MQTSNFTKLTNTEVLCYVLGWQGGTVHQVQQALAVRLEGILESNAEAMGELCRRAQVYRRFHEGKDETELTRLIQENERLTADNERLRKALK